MTSPFDWIKSINEKTRIDMTLIDSYNPFIVNRGLSYFIDTVMFANEMNRFHFLDKDIQYEFLYRTINKRKRFAKWVKKLDETNLSVIKEWYKCNDQRAMEIASLLNDKQIEQIKLKLYKGGR